MIHAPHDVWLAAASYLVATMAGFTGLILTRGASRLSPAGRKRVVSMAAVALGIGIWSMHFLAMLGMRLPEPFYYSGLQTMISALVAILVAGGALLMLHFWRRSRACVIGAGALVGVGISSMHDIGMAAMVGYAASSSVLDIAVVTAVSSSLSIGLVWIGYGAERTVSRTLAATLAFGLTVFVIHFLAIALTDFTPDRSGIGMGPDLDNETLALLVALSVFAISGAFLLTGVNLTPDMGGQGRVQMTGRADGPASDGPVERHGDAIHVSSGRSPAFATRARPTASRHAEHQEVVIPYERDGRTLFVPQDKVVALQSDGHYTHLVTSTDRLFCPWSISQAENRLSDASFLRTHRRYLVNTSHIVGFQRRKDIGLCTMTANPAVSTVPVSRTRLAAVKQVLGV